MTSIPAIRQLEPATLSPLPITPARHAELAAMRPSNREHALGLMAYAHLYRETCRIRHVAILSHHADLALQAHWQQHREDFIERALFDYPCAIMPYGAAENAVAEMITSHADFYRNRRLLDQHGGSRGDRP